MSTIIQSCHVVKLHFRGNCKFNVHVCHHIMRKHLYWCWVTLILTKNNSEMKALFSYEEMVEQTER